MVTLGVAREELGLMGLAVEALEAQPLLEEQEVEVLPAQEFLRLVTQQAEGGQAALVDRLEIAVMQVTPAARRPQP